MNYLIKINKNFKYMAFVLKTIYLSQKITTQKTYSLCLVFGKFEGKKIGKKKTRFCLLFLKTVLENSF